jgi:acyl transferase domain-containing protein
VGQILAAQRAWENAGLDPATATLVEAHGTSTKVGDVVEVESLTEVFGGAPRHSIGLGSAKSNIGHLKAGAGAAGLLKATMAIHHKVLPPTLNSERPNPNIDFANSPFYLIHERDDLGAAQQGAPRRAGVSAYGFGGTNFHVVLEEHVPGMLHEEPKVYAAATANGGDGQPNQLPTRPANRLPTHEPHCAASMPSAPTHPGTEGQAGRRFPARAKAAGRRRSSCPIRPTFSAPNGW